MNRKAFITVLALLPCLLLSGQSLDKPRMDSLFTIIEDSQRGMGSISIFENGKEVYQRSFGYASVGDRKLADRNTKYRIGSVSKMFTASVILKLIEQGELSLETKLSLYFPGIKNSGAITVGQMLRHRSGIFNFTNAPEYVTWMENPVTRDELVRRIASYESSFEPDEKAEYSNSNFVLLSFIAEKITGREFPEIIKEMIARPCGLEETYYGSRISIANNEALSYIKSNGWQIATETDMSVPSGAGAIVANPADLNIFMDHLFNGNIVSPESLKMMMNIQDGFGMGMFPAPFYDKTAFGHTGGIDGFQSSAFYFPTEKVSVALLSNGVAMPMNDILIGVLSIYFGMKYELPLFVQSIETKPEELDKYLGVYSSPQLPLKLTISREGNVLMGQGTGQPAFPLEAYEENKFRFEQAGLTIEFIPEENKMILRQGGGVFELAKEPVPVE